MPVPKQLPGLKNPFVVNNICHFVQSTKPTTGLTIGDKWYKPTDNGIAGTCGDWIWSGSDWVSENLFSLGAQIRFATNTGNAISTPIHWNGSILVEEIMHYAGNTSGTYDANNYWTQQLLLTSGTSGGLLTSVGSAVNTLQSTGQFKTIQTINTVYSMVGRYVVQINYTRVGTAGNFIGGCAMNYRYLHP